MRTLLLAILQALEEGTSVELVSVLSASGSTPRGAGAVMAVFPEGRTLGTVGGGNVEYEASGLACELLRRGQSALRELRFTPGEDSGMVCGGTVTLHFHYLHSGNTAVLSALRQLWEVEEATGASGCCGVWRGAEVSEMLLTGEPCAIPDLPAGLLEERASLREGWFALPAVRAGIAYLFGGGHVSQALAPLLDGLGFPVAVWDDRPEFASRERFPQAERLYCGPFEEISRRLAFTPSDYLIVMTRGHQADYTVLAQVLRSGARYLGCIGSRKKLDLCRERLLEEGFTEEEYARLHAPIGLSIGAETPAEIAVSVAAELVGVRAGVLR